MEKWHTLTEMSAATGISHLTLKLYCQKGKIPAAKVAGKWRVSEETIERFMKGEFTQCESTS